MKPAIDRAARQVRCVIVAACGFAMLLFGCAAKPDYRIIDSLSTGEYGLARVHVQSKMTMNRGDRDYMLDRLRLTVLALADGVSRAAEPAIEEMYDILRTQGINADKTVSSVVINEDLKFWKGEPFEQAMALFYVSVYNAMMGEWGNARAAAGNSLFHLRDFDTPGERGAAETSMTTEDLVRRAAQDEDYLDHGYVVRESDFALGYLLSAIANQQLERPEEASDNYAAALRANPALDELVRVLRGGDFNTLFIVDYGLGPRKTATGPDGAIARFVPSIPSDSRPIVLTARGERSTFAAVTDLNAMARDHMWNNLEDVRIAKSEVGTALLAGGAIMTGYGASHDHEEGLYAGLGMMLAGAFAKAGAHADTRHAEVLPQRVYLVPANVPTQSSVFELMVEGVPASRLRLSGLAPPREGEINVRYVRLRAAGRVDARRGVSSLGNWATSGQVYYCNDATAVFDEPHLPYILGGYCVSTPNEDILLEYQRGGFLTNMTVTDLEELYRLEGIQIAGDDPATRPGLHVLEGGNWLYTPLAGTAGFARLFGQEHPPYEPRSPEVRTLAAETWNSR